MECSKQINKEPRIKKVKQGQKKENQIIFTPLTKKAQTVIYSWLNSWGVEVSSQTPKDQMPHLLVNGQIKVFVLDGKPPKKKGCVYLSTQKINSKDVKIVIKELGKIFKKINSKCPDPPRTQIVTRTPKSDIQGVSMRLSPFCKAANPKMETIRRYDPIIRREAERAARRYRYVCDKTVMDSGDLYTVGVVFLCIFLHRYQDLNSENNTGAFLTKFLRQEYSRWNRVMGKYSGRSCDIPPNYVMEDLLGHPKDYSVVHIGRKRELSYEMTEPDMESNNSEDDTEIVTNKLKQRFKSLTPYQQVMACAKVADDPSQAVKVRNLAKARLARLTK